MDDQDSVGGQQSRWGHDSRGRAAGRKEEWRKKETDEGSFKTTCGPTIFFDYLLILLIGSHVVQNHLHVKTPYWPRTTVVLTQESGVEGEGRTGDVPCFGGWAVRVINQTVLESRFVF